MDPELYRSAMVGHVDFLQQNIEHVRVQITPNMNTVLHVASRFGQIEYVNEILRNCPSLLTMANIKGDSALHIAARGGHSVVAQSLIEQARAQFSGEIKNGDFTSVEEFTRMRNEDEDTALHEAVRCRDIEIVKLLTNEDPDFSHPPNLADETPLYLAAEMGLDEFVYEILKNCAKPSYTGPFGRTALHAAILANSEGPIFDQVLKGLQRVTWTLLEWKPNLGTEVDADGWLPLHYGAKLGHIQMVRQLLNNNRSLAYFPTSDDCKNAVLHIAADKGNIDLMKEIMSHCPDSVKMANARGRNIIHIAVENKKIKTINFILRQPFVDSLINQKDVDGNTPLHLLAVYKCRALELIFHPKANVAYNKENKSPLDLCSTLKVIDVEDAKKLQLIKSDFERASLKRKQKSISKDKTSAEEDDEKSQAKKQVSRMVSRANANLLVAALVATITFAAGGYNNNSRPNEGMAVLTRKAAFNAFVITDIISVMCSSCSAFVYFFLTGVDDHVRILKYLNFANKKPSVSTRNNDDFIHYWHTRILGKFIRPRNFFHSDKGCFFFSIYFVLSYLERL
ncbi:hypothetical protein LguiB_017820 [Lonicera macranthoides]